MKKYLPCFVVFVLLLISCSEDENPFPCEIDCRDEILIIGLANGGPTEILWDDIVDDFEGNCDPNKFGIELFDANGIGIKDNIANTAHVNDTLSATVKNGNTSICTGKILIRNFDEEELIFETNKITCLNCHGFGYYIEAEGEYLFIADFNTIWVVKMLEQGFEFIQKIEASSFHSIRSLMANEGKMAFGMTTGSEEGSVLIYELVGDLWQLKQEIRGTENGSDFGRSIDIFGEWIVIGAPAVWSSAVPKVYVFKQENDNYILDQALEATDPSPGHRFGESVAIQGDFLIASSVFNMLHIYEFKNDDWNLFKTEDLRATRIRHDGNQFIITTEQDIIGFELDSEGELIFQEVNPGFYKPEIAGHGEVVDIRGDIALLAVQTQDECYTVQFDGNAWLHERKISSFEGDVCAFAGFEITDDYLITGGEEVANPYPMGYVYLIER